MLQELSLTINSDSFNTALQTYGDKSIYAPEKARAHFLRARAYQCLHNNAQADKDEAACLRLYREATPDDQRPLSELTPAHFDRIIVFWSR